MFSNTEGFADNSPISPLTPTPINKPSARKLLCMFTNILKMKKTAYRWFGSTQSKRKAVKFVNKPWALKQNRKGYSKIMKR